MHSGGVDLASPSEVNDALFAYIDGILNTEVVRGLAVGEQNPIGPEAALVPVWTAIDRPARALIAVLFLLALSRPLANGRLKSALLKACGHALELV